MAEVFHPDKFYEYVIEKGRHTREYEVTVQGEELAPFLAELGTHPSVEFKYTVFRHTSGKEEFSVIFRVEFNAFA